MNFYGLTVSGGYSLGTPIGDAQFKNTTLLLSPTTTQAKSTTTVDSSTNALTVTRNGNPSTQWPSPYQSTGYWSSYFNGTSSYITFSNTSLLSAVDVATGSDCTYEFWIYPLILRDGSFPYYSPTIWSKGTIYASAFVRADGTFTHYTYNGSPQYVSTAAGAVVINRWTHVAVVLTNNLVTIYINGVSSGSGTRYAAQLSGQALKSGVGDVNFSTCFWFGYISNFRIVTSAIYTGAFTPPTAPLTPITNTSLLTFQNNLYKDNSTNNVTLALTGSPQISDLYPLTTINANQGYFSGSFNGSSYLSVAGGSGTAMGTSDFTWECWVYPTASTNYQAFIDTRTNPLSGGDTTGFYFGTNTGTLTPMYYTNTLQLASSINIILNAWNHVALTRASGTVTIWVNGASGGSRTGDTTNLTQQRVFIGSSGLDLYLNGRLSNLRMVKGTVVYTTSFSPSIIPLRAIANTSLLTLQNTTFVDNSTNAFTITATGSPSTNVVNPFTTAFPPSNYFPALGAGMYFNGTSDYLTAPSTVVSTIGTGAFTIEGWFYSQDFTIRTIYFQRLWSFGNGLANDVTLNIDTSGFLVYRNNDTALITASTAATLYTWYHVALVRSGSTTTIYLNGVSVGTTATSNNFTVQGGYSLYIGNESGSTRGGYFIGYMSNFRVVPGIAVYTGTFTPPSMQPLTTAGSTSALCYTSTTNINTSFAAANTSLLLNFADSNLTDGVFNTGQNNTFLDTGPNSFAITRNGTPTQGSLTPYIPNGYWSGYFNGSTDYLSLANNSAFDFGSGNFTVECWVYPLSSSYNDLVSLGNGTGTGYGWWFRRNADSTIVFFFSSNGQNSGITSATILQSTITAPLNAWAHIAAVRSGSTGYIFINGAVAGTNVSVSGSIYAVGSQVLNIGREGNYPAGYTNAYLSNLRIVKGTAVYTSAFTPPTTPLTAITNTSLLTCQSNRFIDNGIANSGSGFPITVNGTTSIQAFKPFNPPVAYLPTIYGGSGIFNGSTDYLTAPSNTAFTLTGNFTVEAWAYFTNTSSSYDGIMCTGPVGTIQVFISKGDAGIIDGVSLANQISWTTVYNQWVHYALVCNGSALTMYVNGISVGTVTKTLTPAGTNLAIGRRYYDLNSYLMNGYISNLRIVKGTAVYTGTFTPPILPLANSGAVSSASYSSTTNVNTSFSSTQCSLLTNFTNSGITDFTTNNNLTTVGDAKVSTTAAKYGLASFYFDGTGDYLNLGSGPSLDVNNGDFTIEGWIYPVTAANYNEIITLGNAIAGGYSAIRLRMNSSRQLELYMSTNGSTWSTFGTTTETVSLNTWTYITLVRSGSSSGNVKLYFNGTATSLSLTFTGTGYSGGQYSIGCVWSSSAPTSFWNGYLQDFRITKGYARYLSNFTTPTDSFTQGGGIGSVPGAPTIGTATKTNTTTATVTFTPPANTGGYAITTYTATSSIGNITGTSTTSPITISGLTSGTGYSFTVTATNSLGVSSPSAASNTVGGTAIRSFLITQMDPIYTLNTTITTAIGITKIQSYSMAILYGDD